MKHKILYSDLLILRDLFFSKKTQLLIIDEADNWQEEQDVNVISNIETGSLTQYCNNTNAEFILVNFSTHSLKGFYENSRLEGIIDFSKKNKKGSTAYYFINNPDQSMRWIFPKKSKSPAFLHLYNGSGIKAMVFKKAAKTLHASGWIKPITSGEFSVFIKKHNTIANHFGDLKFDDFAIFTGTIGENRKAIIALTEQKRCTQFIKIPLTNAAQKLVDNEYEQLKSLTIKAFDRLVFPKTTRTKTGVAVSNVQPEEYKKDTSLQAIHFQALQELYDRSVETKSLEELAFWKTIRNGIDFFSKIEKLENGLTLEKTKQLQNICETIFYSTNTSDDLKVGIGHGDFTPWNMYVSENKLHLYDWEMCATDTPLLFDVFHFVFQKGILIERKKISGIKKDLQNILSLPDAEVIISSYQLNWKKYYQLYLLYIVCYYLPKYAVQPRLHDQVHWLIDTWLAGLEEEKIAEVV